MTVDHGTHTEADAAAFARSTAEPDHVDPSDGALDWPRPTPRPFRGWDALVADLEQAAVDGERRAS